MDIMDIACTQRAERSARKQAAEQQVHVVEERLQALRQELFDAEKDLQEVNETINALRDRLLQPQLYLRNVDDDTDLLLYHPDAPDGG